jgi:hypothetical protein
VGTVEDITKNLPHGVYHETCHVCGHKVIGVVPLGANLKTLECSACGACDSTAILVELDESGEPVDTPSG